MTGAQVLDALNRAASEAAERGRTLELAELPTEAYAAVLERAKAEAWRPVPETSDDPRSPFYLNHSLKPFTGILVHTVAGPVRLEPVSRLFSSLVAFDTTGEPWPADLAGEFGDDA